MIFVTVGTHEQPFNRLVQKIDELKRDGVITEDVVIQTGFSTYEPKYCKWQKLFPFQDMGKYVEQARIVITHGGPSSFIMPLQIGKIPIVVPRQSKFNEHVNDHQVLFARAVKERYGNLIVVEDIERLGEIIKNYDKLSAGMHGGGMDNNAKFCEKFEELANELVGNNGNHARKKK
jgi:UDP-N-acetylglucosamine transferase subunit ALG13